MEEFFSLNEFVENIKNDRKPHTKDSEFSCVDDYPLAMTYVPMQRFENLYSRDTALYRGTLYKDLDKPFCGRKFY